MRPLTYMRQRSKYDQWRVEIRSGREIAAEIGVSKALWRWVGVNE